MEQITVEIDEQGNPTISVKGVKGAGCQKLTADLEKALGKVTDSKTTREYAERPRQAVAWAGTDHRRRETSQEQR